jgi:hypothetical protein
MIAVVTAGMLAAVNPQHGASVPPWVFIALVVVIIAVAVVMFARRKK